MLNILRLTQFALPYTIFPLVSCVLPAPIAGIQSYFLIALFRATIITYLITQCSKHLNQA